MTCLRSREEDAIHSEPERASWNASCCIVNNFCRTLATDLRMDSQIWIAARQKAPSCAKVRLSVSECANIIKQRFRSIKEAHA